MNPVAAANVARGRGYVDTARGVAEGVPQLARGVGKALDVLGKPLEMAGPHLLRATGNIGNAIARSPKTMKTLAAGAITAPILASAFSSAKKKQEQDFLMSSQDPERVVIAAAAPVTTTSSTNPAVRALMDAVQKQVRSTTTSAAPKNFMHVLGDKAPEALAQGLLGGIGSGIVDYAFSGVKALGKMGLNALFTNPQRQKVFEEALRTDAVLQDAVQHNPDVIKALGEAFATLVRFAPSLALDINAVRSYLREAVISGGGINYATIKQLADTEKVIGDRSRGDKK